MTEYLSKNIISKIILDKKRKVFLYGAGFGPTSYSRITLAALNSLGVNVEYFLDDDKDKEGKDIDGITIKNINELLNYDKNDEAHGLNIRFFL